MVSIKIDDSNRDEIQDRYISYLISRMDFMEIRESLRDYLNTEKIFCSHQDLLDEIRMRGPETIGEIFGSSKSNPNKEVLL